MAEASQSSRTLLERLGLATVGAVVLTAERAEELAGELAERGGMTRDEARQLIDDAMTRWRGDASRLAERAGDGLQSVFGQLGLVTRDEYEELELRVAQLEHRLRLAEERVEGRLPDSSARTRGTTQDKDTESSRARSPRVRG